MFSWSLVEPTSQRRCADFWLTKVHNLICIKSSHAKTWRTVYIACTQKSFGVCYFGSLSNLFHLILNREIGMSITCCITNKIYTLLSACLLPPHAVSTPARLDPLVSSGSRSGSRGERGREKGRGRGRGRGKKPSTPRKRRVVKPGLKSQGRVIHYILQRSWLFWLLATMVIAKSSKNY